MLCGYARRVTTSWNGELQWAMQRMRGKSLVAIIMKVAWHAVIYFTWMERNNRLHKGKVTTEMQVLERIKEVIRIRLMRLKKVKLDSVNFTLYRSWNLSQTNFV